MTPESKTIIVADMNQETKQVVGDLANSLVECDRAVERFRENGAILWAEVGPVIKEIARPTPDILVAATAFYRTGAAVIDYLGMRLQLLAVIVREAAVLPRVREALDQHGAIPVDVLEGDGATDVVDRSVN